MVHSVGAVKKFGPDKSLQTVLVTDGMTKFEVELYRELYIIHIHHHHNHINLG